MQTFPRQSTSILLMHYKEKLLGIIVPGKGKGTKFENLLLHIKTIKREKYLTPQGQNFRILSIGPKQKKFIYEEPIYKMLCSFS